MLSYSGLMEMRINGRDLLNLISEGMVNDRKQTSYYISQKLHERLKKVCGVIPASLVVESMIKEFIETFESSKAPSKSKKA